MREQRGGNQAKRKKIKTKNEIFITQNLNEFLCGILKREAKTEIKNCEKITREITQTRKK